MTREQRIRKVRQAANKARKNPSGGTNGGRPMIEDRCPCGLYSAEYAAKRGHRCKAKTRRAGR